MKNKSGKVGKWFDFKPLNSFAIANPGHYLNPGYMIDELGFVHLRGAVTNAAAGGGAVIAQLPPAYRPERNQHDTTLTNTSATMGHIATRFYIAKTGGISAPGTSGAIWINLSGISWWVGKERLRQL